MKINRIDDIDEGAIIYLWRGDSRDNSRGYVPTKASKDRLFKLIVELHKQKRIRIFGNGTNHYRYLVQP